MKKIISIFLISTFIFVSNLTFAQATNDTILVQFNNLKIREIQQNPEEGVLATFIAEKLAGFRCRYFLSEESTISRPCSLRLRREVLRALRQGLRVHIYEDTELLGLNREVITLQNFQVGDRINVYGELNRNTYEVDALIVRKIGTTPTTTPTITPTTETPTTTPTTTRVPPCYIPASLNVGTRGYGDVDGDGLISSSDAEWILQYVVGLRTLTPEQIEAADVDGLPYVLSTSTDVTAVDALMVQRYVSNLISTFNACPGNLDVSFFCSSGNIKANLSWSPKTGASSYKAWYKTSTSNSWYGAPRTTGTTTTIPLYGSLLANTNYDFKVVWYDQNGIPRLWAEKTSLNSGNPCTGSTSTTTPSITVLSPNGGEVWEIGRTYEIRWTNNTGKYVVIELVRSSTQVSYPITSADPTKTSFTWTIPSTIQPAQDYKIRIKTTDGTAIDTSDYPFSIVSSTSASPGLKTPPCDGYGDVNFDGYVTQDDADLVLRYVSALTNFTPEQIRRADVDGKDGVTAVDALLIMRYVQGLTNSFGVCKF